MTSTLAFSDDAPREAIKAALRDPSLGLAGGGATPIVVARCETLSILALNDAAAAKFGANFEAVARRLFRGRDPGAQRLSVLAGTLQLGAAPRLERIRIPSFGRPADAVTFLCKCASGGPGTTLLLLTVPSSRAPWSHAAPASAESYPQEDAMSASSSGAPSRRPRMRILWRTDRDDRLLDVSPPFGAQLRSPVHVTGRSFREVLAEIGADPEGSMERALATRATFAGVTLHWPAQQDGQARVDLGAVPVFEGRQFDGFRGYATVQPKRETTLSPSHEVRPRVDATDAAVARDPSHPSDAVREPTTETVAEDAASAPHVLEIGPASPTTASPAVDEHDAGSASNVVPIRGPASLKALLSSPDTARVDTPALTPAEQSAFDEIARTLTDAGPDHPTAMTAPASVAEGTGRAAMPIAPSDLSRLVDLVPIGILVSRGGVPIFANRTLLDFTGFETTAQIDDAGGLARLFGGTAPDTAVESTTAVGVVTRDGETIPVDVRMHAIAWGGEAATLLSLRRALDRAAIAKVATLETSLRERDAETHELHAILDTATDGVVVFDTGGEIKSLNRSAEALFGREASEVTGHPLETLVAEESRSVLADYLSGLREGGVASLLNDGRAITFRGPRDGTIPVFMAIGRIGSDEAPKFCGVLRDLSAWKKAEHSLTEARTEAERASAQKSEFLARISHEIRTPLNAILGFAEVIMDERFGPVGNERYREYMKDIHRSGEHVMSLVNDLLDLSKIEAGKMDMLFTAVDANAGVSDCVALMQPQASRARVIIRLSLAPRLPKIVVDDRAFKQIVLNVLSNAVKYNEPGGQVIVSTARTDAGHAVVRVRDTGQGMTDAELQTALEPFGQIATSQERTGTGLGLPLTKALVEANRASFTIKSRKGEGTLVEIAFPPSRVMAE